MRATRVAEGVLALGICALSLAVCQAQVEGAGQLLNIETNVGTGYNCGRASSPLYCYGIPVNMGSGSSGNSTLWLDTYVTGPDIGTGFVLFNGVADLGEGHVTSNVASTNASGQVTKLVVNFKGSTNDGDNGTYTGTMTLTSSYYYSSGGGGRGGAGAVWRFICTGGGLQIAYQ
jgi:hypothetical protein